MKNDQHLQTHLVTRCLGLCAYQPILQQMKDFTQNRTSETPDELWYLEHTPVFTQGQTGRQKHILDPGNIPIVHSDRGGQITYHGPGQLIIYLLCDLRRKHLGIKTFIEKIQETVIILLDTYDITATAHPNSPGIYVADQKISSLGFRIRRGCAYHGISLNVDMDLTPFTRINPCGYPNLKMVQLSDFDIHDDIFTVTNKLVKILKKTLIYTQNNDNDVIKGNFT